MTRIEIYSKDKKYLCIQAKDHAGNSEACNGIAAIMYALGGYVHNKLDEKRYGIFFKSGDSSVILNKPAYGEVEAAFEMAHIGLLQIQKQYPDNVQIIAKLVD